MNVFGSPEDGELVHGAGARVPQPDGLYPRGAHDTGRHTVPSGGAGQQYIPGGPRLRIHYI